MKKLALLLLTTLCFFSLSGCSHSTQGLALPFEISDITSLTLYHYDAVPQNAEKKVITDQEDIQDLYDALQTISLQKKDAEPAAGASVTIFRFTVADDSVYQITYVANAVKNGLLRTSADNVSYVTSADLGSYWVNMSGETAAVDDTELNALYSD